MSQSIVLGPEFKSVPPGSWGKSLDDFISDGPTVASFQTPLLTLDRSAITHNVKTMMSWVASCGFTIAPHGKTTMAPQLWRQLLDAGAWGITLATGWQVQLARSFGISRILLANAMVDPVVLKWLAAELGDPDFEFSCWVDSVETVAAMTEALAGTGLPRQLPVIVELGAPGGRAGARTVRSALRVVAAVEASDFLTLAGVGGYEGSLADERSNEAISGLRRYFDDLIELHDSIDWRGGKPIVTAGGSAFFDIVAECLMPLVGRADVVLRSGAFQIHDDGFYRGISPFADSDTPFTSALHGWTRVISRPEPGLAILDGGKRDFPFDLDLPKAQLVAGLSDDLSVDLLRDSEVLRLNDQHMYLKIREDRDLPVGSVVRLGLSHPCTAIEKWRLIPVVEDSTDYLSPVVDLVRTWF